jgi:hypothetical protein
MQKLIEKLNYKGQERIAVMNSDEEFTSLLSDNLKDVTIDKVIDQRYPYSFIIVFVKSKSDVNRLTCIAIHNLIADGILWFCYPKKSSKKYKSDLDRDHGWEILNNSGFHGIRMVSFDEDWSALRFRNVKFIKSTRDKLTG